VAGSQNAARLRRLAQECAALRAEVDRLRTRSPEAARADDRDPRVP
jgi:outer membrane murein-binding lipoprotein Lpp